MTDPERMADAPRILDLLGTAALRPPPLGRDDAEAHGHPDHLMTALLEKQRRHRGIDAAAHGDGHLFHHSFLPIFTFFHHPA